MFETDLFLEEEEDFSKCDLANLKKDIFKDLNRTVIKKNMKTVMLGFKKWKSQLLRKKEKWKKSEKYLQYLHNDND